MCSELLTHHHGSSEVDVEVLHDPLSLGTTLKGVPDSLMVEERFVVVEKVFRVTP